MYGKIRSHALTCFTAITLLGASAFAVAQAAPAAPKTWDLFAGASYVRLNASAPTTVPYYVQNLYGFDVSVAELPYASHPWVGMIFEATGAYGNSTMTTSGTTYQVSSSLYTFMGGPLFAIEGHRANPFARVLLGAVAEKDSTAQGSNQPSAFNSNFGYAVGGGVDFPFLPSWSARAQADLVRTQISNTQNANNIRGSAGLVYKF